MKFTKTLIDTTPCPAKGQVILRDSTLPGFGVRLTPTCKSFIVEGLLSGTRKRVTLGRCERMNLEDARQEAQKILADWKLGIDLSKMPPVPTLSEVLECFLLERAMKLETKKTYRSLIERSMHDWLKLPVNAASNVTLYEYDGFDRLSEQEYPDSSKEQFTYDANNSILTMVTRNLETITNTYDVLTRLISRSPGSLPEQTFTYDLAGRQLSVGTSASGPGSGIYGYSYDTAGRLIQQTMPNGDTVGYQLDKNGNRTQLIYPDGYYAEYAYDQLNRLTTISLNGSTSASVSFEYDELSRRTQVSYDNGCVTNYAYALNNDLTSLQHLFVGSAVTFQFACNNVHQLVGLSADDSTFLWEPPASSIVTYATANNLNQYPSVGGTDYSYNSNGCLTGGPQSATFDALNRITQIVSGSITNNYWIDPLNRQATKSVNGTNTNYLYNAQQLIATYDDSGTLLSRFIPGLGLDEHFISITSGGSYWFRNC